MEIIKEIGTPAMLEQCAEECSELAHACLKMSRRIESLPYSELITGEEKE